MPQPFFDQRNQSPAGAERQLSTAEKLRRGLVSAAPTAATAAPTQKAAPTRSANPLRPIQTSKAVARALVGGRR